MNAGRPTGRPGPAHDLRSSLNAIRGWAHVLESRLGGSPDPMVRRAIEGIHAGVDQQVEVIESLLEAGAAQPPSNKLTRRGER